MAAQEKLTRAFTPLVTPAAVRDYQGFQWWHILLTEPNRERRSAQWLERIDLPVYLPQFGQKVRCRGSSHRVRLKAVMPGLLFVPREIMEVERRDETLEWAHVRGFIRSTGGQPAVMSKADIEIIREIEAKLNLPPEAKGVLFKVGQEVRFSRNLYAVFWGTGRIIDIASEARIGIEVKKLFGRATKVYVPASEIEAL